MLLHGMEDLIKRKKKKRRDLFLFFLNYPPCISRNWISELSCMTWLHVGKLKEYPVYSPAF